MNAVESIVHVITKGDVGGAQTHLVELALVQHRRGIDVAVITGLDGPAMDRLRTAGVEVVILDDLEHAIRWGPDRRAVARLRREFRERTPDVVHCHSSKGGLLARIAARREHVASVYTAHGFPFQRGAPLRQRVLSTVGEIVGGRLGSAVICLTTEERDLAARWHVAAPTRLHVVVNGLPDDAPRRTGPVGDRVHIVMVARFAPPKLQRTLVDVMAGLVDLDWTLTFVGDGPDLDTDRVHGRAVLGERVDHLGHRDDVADVLAAHDICVLWSRYEGMPISLLEAMRAGLACVASDLPGVRLLFGDGAGLVAPDANGLAATLRGLIGDHRAIEKLAAAGRTRFEDAFTIEAVADAVDDVYRAVLQTVR